MRKLYSKRLLLPILSIGALFTGHANFDKIARIFAPLGTISGVVYRDINFNGVKDNTATYNEPFVAGITVTAYNDAGAVVGTAVTTATGPTNYSITATGKVRLEFTGWASTDTPSKSGADNGTNVQFVDATSNVTADFAINDPNDYNCAAAAPFSALNLYVPRQVPGNPLVAGTTSSTIALWEFPYSSSGSASYSGTTSSPAGASPLSTAAQIGTTYGVAYSKQANRVFTSAFMKRHHGFGPGNGTASTAPGAIYIVDPTKTATTGATTYFTSLDVLGGATHTSIGTPIFTLSGSGETAVVSFSSDANLGIIGTPTARGLGGNISSASTDAAAMGQVSKVSIGDIDISDDGKFLYVTNLFDRKVYVLQLNDPVKPTSATIVTSVALPNPPLRSTSYIPNAAATYTGTNNNTDFYTGARGLQRPFGLKYSKGKLYVGAVTTGEGASGQTTTDNNTGNPEYTDLWAYVYEFNPATNSFVTAPKVEFPLNFNRGVDGDGIDETWRRWNNGYGIFANDNYNQNHQPILSDIEFDVEGSMVLGFRDRGGDQTGYNQNNLNGTANTEQGRGFGDILRAYFNPSTGLYEMERNGKEGINSPKAATVGAGDGSGNTGDSESGGDGPSNYTGSNGEFYWQDHVHATSAGTGTITNGLFHMNTTEGALVLLKGSGEVTTTTMDPMRAWSQGISWFSNTTGANVRDYEMIAGTDPNNGFSSMGNGDVGKANGLGDLEIISCIQPIEIGNRIWYDADGDGIQDATETTPGVPSGTTVTLRSPGDDGIFGNGDDQTWTTTTDANGNYYFNSGNVTTVDKRNIGTDPGSTVNLGLNVTGILPDQPYRVEVAVPANQIITTADAAANANDTRDSDATLLTNTTTAIVNVNTDVTDHDYDIGFTPTVSVGSTIFIDKNNNGLKDVGDNGISGVTVKLYAANGTTPIFGPDGVTQLTTVTDANGNYIFTGLPAGTYVIGVIPSATYPVNSTNSTTKPAGDNQTDDNDDGTQPGGAGTEVKSGPIVLTVGAEPLQAVETGIGNAGTTTTPEPIDANGDMTIDFGFFNPVSIGSTVFIDTNNDGTQSGATELGISGLTVNLYFDANGDGSISGTEATTPFATTTTNGTGDYSFINLVEGKYIVGVVPNTAYPKSSVPTVTTDITTDDGKDNGTQATIGTEAKSAIITLTAGAEPTADETAQANGQDTAFPGGDANGDMTVDFGFFKPVNLSGTVFLDTNGLTNSIVDGTATNVGGTLYATLVNSAGTPIATVPIDVNGNYNFPNIDPDTYSVVLSTNSGGTTTPSLPAGYVNTGENLGLSAGNDGQTGGITANGILTGITVGSIDVPNANFGIQQPPTTQPVSSLANNPNSTVILSPIATDVAPGTVDLTTVRLIAPAVPGSVLSPDGKTLFVPGEGTYTVDPTTGVVTYVPSANVDPTPITYTVLDNAGAISNPSTITISYIKAKVNISGNVFNDVDALTDNLVDGTIPSATPLFANLFDAGGGFVASVPVVNGAYLFTALNPNQTYTVAINNVAAVAGDSPTSNLPAGWLHSGDQLGTVAGVGIDPTNGIQSVSVTTIDIPNVNFGIVQPVSIGSTAFVDNNNNAVQDPGDLGIGGLTVNLYYDANNNGVIDGAEATTPFATTTTSSVSGSVGDYLFSGLMPGNYKVGIVPNSTYPTSSKDIASSLLDNSVDSNDNGIQASSGTIAMSPLINLISGAELVGETGQGNAQDNALPGGDANGDMTIDFGFYSPLSLGSTAFIDLNNDGIQSGAGETGIAGLTVTLYASDGTTPILDGLGNPITTTTNSTGDYVFNNLLPGTYVVGMSAPATYPTASTVSAAGVDGTNNGTQSGGSGTISKSGPITLAIGTMPAGETGQGASLTTNPDANTNSTVDFGFVPTLSLGSTAFIDANNNGKQDSGEGGISGLTVSLLDGNGNPVLVGGNPVTTTTNATGDYVFNGLLPGTYKVSVAPNTTYPLASSTATLSTGASTDVDANNNGTQAAGTGTPSVSGPITLAAGTQPTAEAGQGVAGLTAADADGNATIDFGFVPPLSLGSTAFIDANNNGKQDSGEGGISGFNRFIIRWQW
jgi:SdrD B-like domain